MAYRDVVLADNPRVYWRFGEASGTVAQDETANNTDGNYSSSVILGSTGIISGDTALTIADDTDPAVPNDFVGANSAFTMSDTFSFECWLKRNSATAIERAIFEGYLWGTVAMDASGEIYLAPGTNGTKIMHSSINITDTNWHHLIITKSGSTRKIYIDGVDRTALDTNATLASGSYTFYVGASHSAAGLNLYGGFTYDESAYYTTALTAGQVTTHYQEVFPPPPGPTRFYFPSTGAAAVSPAYASEWEDTTNASPSLEMVRTRISSAFTSFTTSETGGFTANARDLLCRQYVSEPILRVQTISGTMNGQLQMYTPDAASNALPQLIARVVSNDGSTARGTLWGGDTRTTNVDELPSSVANVKNPAAGISPVTLSPVTNAIGDRLVIEIGGRINSTSAIDFRVGMRYGDSGASDLTVGGSETTSLNGWVEFSFDIDFTAVPVAQDAGMVPI